MSYFNYHAKAKNLIVSGHLVKFEIVPKWGKIVPALVLYFDNSRPMPIREHRFDEYLKLLQNSGFIVAHIDNIIINVLQCV